MPEDNQLPVRVWLAERAKVPGPDGMAKMDMQSFKQKLCDTFVPVTYQAMRPFGLTAYIPTLWPYPPAAGAPLDLPEESALVFYESVDKYKRIKESALGRLYFDAHALLFGPGKNKGYPQPYLAAHGSAWSQSFYGGNTPAVAWSSGQVWALGWAHSPALTSTDWVAAFIQPRLVAFAGLQQWIAWSCPTWTVLWVHTGLETRAPDGGHLLNPLFLHAARDIQVPMEPTAAVQAVALDFNQTVRLNPQP